MKRVHAGIAARNGIESADLARAGITGPRSFLTGNRGLYRTFIRKDVGAEATKTFLLSEPLKISQLSFKPYCCCAATHAYIDAMATIRARAADIAGIDARIQTMTDAIVGTRNAHIYQPRNIEELQYSLPVQMALSALDKGNGSKTHRDYLEGRLPLGPDSEVIGLARRIKLAIDRGLDEKYPRNFVADVTVTYRDGRHEDIFLGGAKGMPFNPLTPAEHAVKLDELTDELLGKARADELFGMVDRMEPRRPVADLAALLRRP